MIQMTGVHIVFRITNFLQNFLMVFKTSEALPVAKMDTKKTRPDQGRVFWNS
jgi:hypothetical protein